MKQWLLTTLIVLLLPLKLAAAEIEPFTAHYDVRFSGLAGESVTTLSRKSGNTWVLENRVRAKGLARLVRPGDAVDRSEFTMTGDKLTPVSFVSNDGSRKNKRGNTIDFDWDAGSATTRYKDETRTRQLENGMIDRQLMQIAMMSDLSAGVTDTTYKVIDRHAVKTYQVSVVGEEQIEVPAGNYDVIRLERIKSGSSRSTIFWCAPSLNYLTVRMEQLKDGKTIGTMSLAKID